MREKTFTCGRSVHGDTAKADARDFRALVDRYLAVPIPLPLTRDEFANLPKKDQDETKKVPYLTAATFKQYPCRRKLENAKDCTLLFLDIDDAVSARQIAGNLDVVSTQLDPWAFAVYHTARSTPEKPRIRVVVDADHIPLDRYPEAVATVARRLAVTSIDHVSEVAVQAMYRPVIFRDTEDQPLLLAVTDGTPFTVGDIDTGSADKTKPAPEEPVEDTDLEALDYLRAPVDGVTLDTASEALEYLDPDMSYKDWLEVAAALKHQFPRGRDCDLAYALFDAWSSRGSKYAGDEDTRMKWESLKPSPKGRLPVTFRSIIKTASTQGWNPAGVRQKAFEGLRKWIAATDDLGELLTGAVGRIAAAPPLSRAEEDILLSQVVQRAKKLDATVSAAALRRDLRKVRAKQDEKNTPADKTAPPWVRGICYISATEEFFRHSTGEKYKLPSWDNTFGRRLLPTEKQLEDAGLPVNQQTLSRPFIPPRQFALNVVKVPTVWDYTYDPANPAETVVVSEGKAFVNTYRRTYPKKDREAAEKCKASFERHLEKLIAEPEYRQVVYDWLAFCVQHPGEKIRWSPLVQGAEGCGKTYLSTVLSAVLGQEHVAIIDGKDLFRGWNEWATGHQVVAVEEVRVVGHSRHEIMNALKPLITNDRISIAERFRNNRTVKNITNYIFFTNFKDSLALDHGSRRYFVLQSPLQSKPQIAALGHDYFTTLYGLLQNHPGGFRHFLSEHEISDEFDPNGVAPHTSYLDDLVDASASDTTAAVRRIIREGDHPLVGLDLVSTKVMLDLLEVEGIRVNAQQLSHTLRAEGFAQRGRFLLDEQRHYLWTAEAARIQDPATLARVKLAGEITLEDAI